MQIGEYLDQQKLTLAEFGERVGVTHATVSRWASGKLMPSFRNLCRMQEISDGVITSASFGGHRSGVSRRRTPRVQKVVTEAAGPEAPPAAPAKVEAT